MAVHPPHPAPPLSPALPSCPLHPLVLVPACPIHPTLPIPKYSPPPALPIPKRPPHPTLAHPQMSPASSPHCPPAVPPPSFPACPQLPPSVGSPAGAGGSRQVKQHCPGPRCRWCCGQSSTGQGAKEHSTSPPWGQGDVSPRWPRSRTQPRIHPSCLSPEQRLDPPPPQQDGAGKPWSILGDPPQIPPGLTRQTQVVQSSPSRVNRAPCAYVRPRKLHFAGEERGGGARIGVGGAKPGGPPPASGAGGPGGPTWLAGAAVGWRSAGAGARGALGGDAGDVSSLWRRPWGCDMAGDGDGMCVLGGTIHPSASLSITPAAHPRG